MNSRPIRIGRGGPPGGLGEDAAPSIGRQYAGLSPDLWPRIPREGPYGMPSGVNRQQAQPYMGDAIYLTRNLQGRTITVGTTPVMLVDSAFAWPYLVLNPSKTTGLTTTVTGFSGTVNAAGNSQTTPGSIGVSGFYAAHFQLDVTAVTGTWDIIQQSYDSISAKWFDVQTIYAGVTAIGSYYTSVGTMGITTDLAFRWNPTVAGSLTFSLAAVLKGGLGGSSVGLAQVVYLGGNGVTTTSGFPLLEGQKQAFIVPEGVQLLGVSGTNIDIRVFML